MIAPKADMVTAPTTDAISTNQIVTSTIDSTSTLKSVATFPVGAAFYSNVITSNPKAYQLFLNQFSSQTVKAYMNVEPVQGQFNFKESDYWVKLAQTHPLRLHGHCLVYHIAAPEWLTKFSGNIPDFEQAVKNHIQTVVGRYKGQIKSWDVINEVFDYTSGNIRQTAFRQLYSSDAAYMEFVKHCFEWAHAADPEALLFYNDFNLEAYPTKMQSVLNLIENFKRSGTPIHGIGTQMHININAYEPGIYTSLRQLSSTGLQVHMSELDIAVNPKNDQTIVFSEELLKTQRIKYQSVVTAYKTSVPVAQQYGITMWSFSDADSWLVTDKKRLDQPNIFDKAFNKKPAYYGFLAGLK